MTKKIAILTSGGDAPGMNAVIRGVTRYALAKQWQVYGIVRGYEGLLHQEMIPLGRRDVGEIIHRGGTMLRTARCAAFYQEEKRREAAAFLQNQGIEALVVIGGDGSMRGAQGLSAYGIVTMVIPGTIDNDMAGTQYTIGFDTAVNTVLSSVNKIRDTAFSHERVAVIEVMGRSAGFIALEAGMAAGAEVVLVPEYAVNLEDVCTQLSRSHEQKKMSSIVIFAEGASTGNEVAAYIKAHTSLETNLTVLGYVQRGGSPSAYDAVMAGRFAQCAVDSLAAHKKNCVIGLWEQQVVATPYEEAQAFRYPLDHNLYTLVHILGR
ncbi:ATP-dependent 6-phosphofructokinase [uncultured Megasphaera sp.]|uniref:ATP-dependent 6-phosphofructokinase n=1 Tax=uncultured Megasphaera sp. TaxID=165188 RepID=UPI00288C4A7F|nr:ATP-dependent 6-phosphofructokinase [uncultured Megasphaera sp.]